MFGKEPLFKGEDNQDQLVKICKVLGTEGLKQYLDRYGLDLPEVYEQSLKDYPRVPWSAFIKASNRAKCTNDALDLLTQLLQYDHQVGVCFEMRRSCARRRRRRWRIPSSMRCGIL